MEIIADDRERATTTYFQKYSDIYHVDFQVCRLEVGDYAIRYNSNILVIVERKTWQDLAASMRDGRKHNIEKLQHLQQTTNCKIMYLIEGPACPQPDKLYSRIPAKNLVAHLDHLQFRDNILIQYSNNEETTARRLFEMALNISSCKEVISKYNTTLEVKGGEPEDPNMDLLQTKIDIQKPREQQILQCLPSVGSIVAHVLATNGVTLKKILIQEITTEEIAMMKFDTGASIGLTRATAIMNNRNILISKTKKDATIQARILSSVPLISRKTADIILQQCSIEELILNKIPFEVLCLLSRGDKPIGKAVAKNILKYLAVIDVDEETLKAVKISNSIDRQIPKKVKVPKVPKLDLSELEEFI
jgi:ERCC4-type nuclease